MENETGNETETTSFPLGESVENSKSETEISQIVKEPELVNASQNVNTESDGLSKPESSSIASAELTVRESLKSLVESFQDVLRTTAGQSDTKNTSDPPPIINKLTDTEAQSGEEHPQSSEVVVDGEKLIHLPSPPPQNHQDLESIAKTIETKSEAPILGNLDQGSDSSGKIIENQSVEPEIIQETISLLGDENGKKIEESNVRPLSPVGSQLASASDKPGAEIKEENIKNALNEIISEIDKVVATDIYAAAPTPVESNVPPASEPIGDTSTEDPGHGSLPTSARNEAADSATQSEPQILYTEVPLLQCPKPTSSTNSIPDPPPPPKHPYMQSLWKTLAQDEEITHQVRNVASPLLVSPSVHPPSSMSPSYFLSRPSGILTPTPQSDDPVKPLQRPAVIREVDPRHWSSTGGIGFGSTESAFAKGSDLDRVLFPNIDFQMEENKEGRGKMFGSSSFYSPNAHPTIEEQVQMATKISKSLTEPQNQKSKGQSMYVKRKEKSFKWVHESSTKFNDEDSSLEERNGHSRLLDTEALSHPTKPIMKLVMNPFGQVMDWETLKKSGNEPYCGTMSPEICHHLVRDLQSPSGKGAQLFATRVKKSENWIVDETNVRKLPFDTNRIGTEPVQRTQNHGTVPKLSPNLPPSSFIDRGRVEHAHKLNEIQERFYQPKVRLIKSPWEAALETGSVDSAFQECKPPRVLNTVVEAAGRKLLETPLSMNYAYNPTFSTPAPWENMNYNYAETQPGRKPASRPQNPIRMTGFGNYNTAPRGFTHGQSIYHPVSFH